MNNHIGRTLAMAGIISTALSAHAGTGSMTLHQGDRIFFPMDVERTWQGGSATFEFSDLLLGALNIANIAVSGVNPGVLTVQPNTELTTLSVPVESLTGMVNTNTNMVTNTRIGSVGGMTMTASGLLSNGKKNSATTGGSLTLTDFQVDLPTRSIYATLTGANGVGTRSNQLIWQYQYIEGATAHEYSYGYWYNSFDDNQFSELTITPDTFNLFAQSLGLTDFGKASLKGVTDYGFLRTHVQAFAIPEPTTTMMMGLGLAGLALISRRAPRTQG